MIESTSTSHRPIVPTLHGEFAPIVINPALAGSAKKKADKDDATLLAYHGLTGVWAPSYLPSGLHHDVTMVSRRYMKAMPGITKATNAIGTRLTDANLLRAREIQIKSASGKAIVQAIVDGVSNPVEAVKRATYSARRLDIPERQEKYQRLIEALTGLPDLCPYVRHVLGALRNNVNHYERQCLVYRDWMYELLRKMTRRYPEGRTLTGVAIIARLETIPGVGSR